MHAHLVVPAALVACLLHVKHQGSGDLKGQCVMPVGSGNLGVGPVPVSVKAKGGDWTVESDTSPTPGRSLVGTRSVYLLANSELLSNTIDKEKVGVGPVPVAQEVLTQRPGPQHASRPTPGTKAIRVTPIPILLRCWPNAGSVTGAGVPRGQF